MDQRENKARIAKLLRKAGDSASSEAEALAAASKAADLMQKHGLSAVEVFMDEVACCLKTKGKSPRDILWNVVALCTNSAAIFTGQWTPEITFFGRAPGPQIAEYLVGVLNGAVDREIAAFKGTAEYKKRRTTKTRKTAVYDFTVGLVTRLARRLPEVFSASMNADHLTDARAALKKRFPETKTVQAKERKTRFGDAAEAGWSAGGKVNLSHGVGGQDRPLQIGGR